jgi:predicted O-methyltransferase YrrM
MLNKLFGRKQPVNEPEIPGDAFDKRLSAIYAAYGQKGQASPYLIQLGLEAAKAAAATDLTEISKRIGKGEVNYIDIFPGEHYQLLGAVVKLLQPKLVVELGTHLGYSSLCMKHFLPEDGKLVTFDVIPWNQFSSTILKSTDFDSRLEQCIDDVTDAATFEKYQSLFENADIIFMDALKDGVQEYQFLANFAKVKFKKKCLFVFDDIRLWNMLEIWHTMEKPKLDLTSFGHWSGTGFVEWN